MTADELVNIWELWDLRPTNDFVTHAMCDACAAYAGAELVNEFRAHLARERREGYTRHEAIARWSPSHETNSRTGPSR